MSSLERLAACSNVHVKLSGLLMPVCGFPYRATAPSASVNQIAEAIEPFITFAIQTFGVQRCQFASNFPVEKVAISYGSLYKAFCATVASRSPADQADLFAGNARRFYGIAR